jgi:hypothetical protein
MLNGKMENALLLKLKVQRSSPKTKAQKPKTKDQRPKPQGQNKNNY